MKCLEHLEHLSRNLTVIILTMAGMYGGSADGGKVLIHLKNTATVPGKYILLKDISSIKGDATLSSSLKNLIIFRKPELCGTAIVSKQHVAKQILNHIKDNPLWLNKKYCLKISGAESCRIKDLCIDTHILKQNIANALEEKIKNIKVTHIYIPSVKLPNENFKTSIKIISIRKNYIRLKYHIINSENQITLPVTAIFSKLSSAVVATKDIRKGQIISKDCLKIKKVPERFARNGFHNIKAITGKIALENIHRGDIITKQKIKPNYLIKHGNNVIVKYKKGNINIEIKAISMADGVQGDIIKVKNPSTGRVIKCRVIGSGYTEFIQPAR